MDGTFSRALLGFILLTTAMLFIAFLALWVIETYAGGSNWAAIIVSIVALAAQIGIYSTTLHEPIYDWIREPKRRAEAEERRKGREGF
jgi:cobalamin biosynthesis protein CobD/CbiB